MFRKMRRFKQSLSDDDVKSVLKSENRGVLSVLGDDGYPYGVPIDFYFDENENKIYFHCAKSGHKLDAIKACPKASFCVYDSGYKKDGDWAYTVKSVIAFGKVALVEDKEKQYEICLKLCEKFNKGDKYVKKEMKNFSSALLCLEFDIEHMTGKLVHEA